MANPEGRPRIPINQQEFEKLCNMLCTEEEIAGWFNCSVDTIARWCQDTYGETFRDAFAKLSSRGKISIRRKQFEVAQSGNVTMLIWLGKQHLGQRDKQEVAVETMKPIEFRYALPDQPPEPPKKEDVA